MAKYGISTCFRLHWPREACERLKLAVAWVAGEKTSATPEDVQLGDETQEVVWNAMKVCDGLGVEISDAPEGGVVVRDKDGTFLPIMTSDLLRAIMRDQNIDGVVAFSWSEKCSDSLGDRFAGGGAVVSRDGVRTFDVDEWLSAAAHELRAECEPSGFAP